MAVPTLDFGRVTAWPEALVGQNYSLLVGLNANGNTNISIEQTPGSPNWLHASIPDPDHVLFSGIPPLEGEEELHFTVVSDQYPDGEILNDPDDGPMILIGTANQHPVTEGDVYSGYKQYVVMPGHSLGVTVDGLADPTLAFTNGDPVESVKLTVIISGKKVGVPPHISSAVPIGDITLGDAFSYTAAVDAGAPVTWDLVSYPAGMTVNHLTGEVRFLPSAAGTYLAILRASNAAGYDEQQIDINVVVALPVFDPDPLNVGPFTVPIANSWLHTFELDAGSPPVTFSIKDDAGWQDYLSNSGTGSITADGTLSLFMNNGGTYDIVIIATNAAGSVELPIEFTMA